MEQTVYPFCNMFYFVRKVDSESGFRSPVLNLRTNISRSSFEKLENNLLKSRKSGLGNCFSGIQLAITLATLFIIIYIDFLPSPPFVARSPN